MSEDRIVVNAPTVVGEVLDDEAIILNLDSGAYFNTRAAGAEIWSGIAEGATILGLAQRLQARFAVSPETALVDAASFVQTLQSHNLVRTEEGDNAADTGTSAPSRSEPYSAPELGVHEDLDDLLRLDPIHDVDDAGWPIANPAAGAE